MLNSQLPRLVLIADGFTAAAVVERTVAAVRAGVRWVQLRDHAAKEAAFDEAARVLRSRLRAVSGEVLVSINTRPGLAEELNAGLHVGARGPSVAEARRALGSDVLLGFSAHGVREGQEAAAAGADYLFVSPVFPTSSKPGHPGIGLASLRTFCAALAGTPVFALGGVTPERTAACLEAGAYGVAVISGILRAADPAGAVRAYQEAAFSPASKTRNPT